MDSSLILNYLTTVQYKVFPPWTAFFLLCFIMQPLDFEAQDEYTLILMVENVSPLSNKAPNLPVSTATVAVTVVNENEAPHFREDPINIVVPESVDPGTVLKNNIAFDPDNSDLRYVKLCFLGEVAKLIGQFRVALTLPLLSVAGMRLAGIPRVGWTLTGIRETLVPGDPLTCDRHMSKTISTMLSSRSQVSLSPQSSNQVN